MTRDRPNTVYFTYDMNNLPHNIFPVDEFGWRWGGEVMVGRRFCGCGCDPGTWSLEADFWSLQPLTSEVCQSVPGSTVGTPLNDNYLNFGSFPATTWFENAAEHRIWRTDEFYNLELNLVRGQWCYGNDSPFDLGWSAGVRFFRFAERLKLGSLMDGYHWGDDGGLDEAYINDQIANNLVGGQIGFELGYRLTNNLRIFASPKFGVFNNHVTNYYSPELGNGLEGQPSPSGGPGKFPVNSSSDGISFLTQIDLGLDWQISQRWSAQVGYRVVAVTGVGLADNQIPVYLNDIPAIAAIDRNGDLVMHGAFMGVSFNF
jgi:hypothetical protein